MKRLVLLALCILLPASVVRADPLPQPPELLKILRMAEEDFAECDSEICRKKMIVRYFGPSTRLYVDAGMTSGKKSASDIGKLLFPKFKRMSAVGPEWGPWTVLNKLGEELPVQLTIERYDHAGNWHVSFVRGELNEWRIEVVKPSQVRGLKGSATPPPQPEPSAEPTPKEEEPEGLPY